MPISRRFRRSVLPTILALPALLSCAGTEEPEALAMESWTLDGPTLRIGALEDGPDALTTVGDLVVDEDGNVFVLLPRDREVRVFDRQGLFLRTIAREGEGPGELSEPASMALIGDTLWITDQGLQRLSAFDRGGTPLRDRAVPPLAPLPDGVGAGPPYPLANGRVAHETRANPFTDLWGVDHRFPLVIRTPGRTVVDSVAIVRSPRPPAFIQTTERAGELVSVSVRRQPFSDETLLSVSPDGREIVLVDRLVPADGDPARYGVTRISADGDTLSSFDVEYAPLPIPARVPDSILQEATAGQGGPSASDLRDLYYFPPSYPPVSAVVAGADGSTWIGRERLDGRPVTWEVFDRDGQPVLRVAIPQEMVVHHADDRSVWGVVTDELDIPYVVRFELVRPSS